MCVREGESVCERESERSDRKRESERSVRKRERELLLYDSGAKIRLTGYLYGAIRG